MAGTPAMYGRYSNKNRLTTNTISGGVLDEWCDEKYPWLGKWLRVNGLYDSLAQSIVAHLHIGDHVSCMVNSRRVNNECDTHLHQYHICNLHLAWHAANATHALKRTQAAPIMLRRALVRHDLRL